MQILVIFESEDGSPDYMIADEPANGQAVDIEALVAEARKELEESDSDDDFDWREHLVDKMEKMGYSFPPFYNISVSGD